MGVEALAVADEESLVRGVEGAWLLAKMEGTLVLLRLLVLPGVPARLVCEESSSMIGA